MIVKQRRWRLILYVVVAVGVYGKVLLSRCHRGLLCQHMLALAYTVLIQAVLTLTVLHLLAWGWLMMLVWCKFDSTTSWRGLLLQDVFVAETWGADKHELFGTWIERLHVVKGLCVTLLIEYLSLRWDSLTRCLFHITIIGIKFDHLFLWCVCYYIREEIASLDWGGCRYILKEIGRCVRLRNLIITLQVIIGSSR
jgi:hypothetical protein